MDRAEVITQLRELADKMSDAWGDSLWIDASDILAAEQAAEWLEKDHA